MIMQKNQNTGTDPNNNDTNYKTISLNPSQTTDKNLIRTTYLRNNQEIQDALNQLDELYFFIRTAPVQWSPYQLMRRYYLTEELGFITCILWNNLFYITGTDIVKSCIYQMEQFGRQIVQRKKFEEGIFSDLRNLKCGKDAILEQAKSNFLSFLFKNVCLKTQKKQKIFFWFNVPHLQLFIDALSRDLKREESNQLATTKAISEPALSFKYDSNSSVSLMDQLISYLNNGKLHGFTNIVTDLEDTNYNRNNTTNNTISNNFKRSRSNTNRFTKKEKPITLKSTKPNLCLPLDYSSTNNCTDTENTYTTVDVKINTNQLNYKSATDNTNSNNSNNDNNIVTHTLILHDNPRLETYNNNDHGQDIASNNFNEYAMKINNRNNKHTIITDKNMKNDNNLLSPLNISFNNGIDNLNDQDFPLDYLPIMDDGLADNKQGRNNKTSISLTKEISNLNMNKDQTIYTEPNNNNGERTVAKEEEEDSDDENIVVPVTVGNFDKNNRYFKPYQFRNLLANKHQMTNKEYYMLNKLNPMSSGSEDENFNEIEITVVPYDIDPNKNIPMDNTNISNNSDKKSTDENSINIENYKDKYHHVNEPIAFDQHEDFCLHPTVAKTNLKTSDISSIQENSLNIHDEYAPWGNTILPFQSYNISMNQHMVLAPPPPQSIYNTSITPVTKFNPYVGQSPWGSNYLSNSVYGINSPPGFGYSVSQPYQAHSINPFSRPSSSINKQFPINKNKVGGKINIQTHAMKSMESPTRKIKRQKK